MISYQKRKMEKPLVAEIFRLADKEQPYMGLLFRFLNENLIPWIEDSYSNNALVSFVFWNLCIWKSRF